MGDESGIVSTGTTGIRICSPGPLTLVMGPGSNTAARPERCAGVRIFLPRIFCPGTRPFRNTFLILRQCGIYPSCSQVDNSVVLS